MKVEKATSCHCQPRKMTLKSKTRSSTEQKHPPCTNQRTTATITAPPHSHHRTASASHERREQVHRSMGECERCKNKLQIESWFNLYHAIRTRFRNKNDSSYDSYCRGTKSYRTICIVNRIILTTHRHSGSGKRNQVQFEILKGNKYTNSHNKIYTKIKY